MNQKASPFVTLFLIAVSLLAPASVLSNQSQKAQAGKLSGLVLNYTSGDPLIKAKVEILGQGNIVETGVDGNYSIALPPGIYSVRIFREGFVEQMIEKVEVKVPSSVAPLACVKLPMKPVIAKTRPTGTVTVPVLVKLGVVPLWLMVRFPPLRWIRPLLV